MGSMGKWQKAPPALVKTFEEAIASLPGIQPRTMFGYPAAFVNGQMFTGLFADSFFVRLPEEGRAELQKQGGRPLEPMPGRPMREYTVVPKQILASRTSLARWIRRSLEYAVSLGPKGKKPSRTRASSRRSTL